MKSLFYQLCVLAVFLLGVISCKPQDDETAMNTYILRLADERPDDVYIEVVEDSSSIKMNYYLVRDSTLYLEKYFLRVHGELYERIFLTSFKGDEKDTVDLLMMSTGRDTSYQHVYADYGKLSSRPLVSKDYRVKIFSEADNHFITEKHSTCSVPRTYSLGFV